MNPNQQGKGCVVKNKYTCMTMLWCLWKRIFSAVRLIAKLEKNYNLKINHMIFMTVVQSKRETFSDEVVCEWCISADNCVFWRCTSGVTHCSAVPTLYAKRLACGAVVQRPRCTVVHRRHIDTFWASAQFWSYTSTFWAYCVQLNW